MLDQIEDSGIGMQIGTIPCSAPTCADDVSLIADSEKNLQGATIFLLLPIGTTSCTDLCDLQHRMRPLHPGKRHGWGFSCLVHYNGSIRRLTRRAPGRCS
jgi:hypothetical protein